MLSSSRAFFVACEGDFSDFDAPGAQCSTIHAIARDGSSGFYAFDSPCSIAPVMQLLGCSAIGGAVSGFPEGGGSSFSERCRAPSTPLPARIQCHLQVSRPQMRSF